MSFDTQFVPPMLHSALPARSACGEVPSIEDLLEAPTILRLEDHRLPSIRAAQLGPAAASAIVCSARTAVV